MCGYVNDYLCNVQQPDSKIDIVQSFLSAPSTIWCRQEGLKNRSLLHNTHLWGKWWATPPMGCQSFKDLTAQPAKHKPVLHWCPSGFVQKWNFFYIFTAQTWISPCTNSIQYWCWSVCGEPLVGPYAEHKDHEAVKAWEKSRTIVL